MMADLPVDLWLDTQQNGDRQMLIPYVRSAEPRQLQYQVILVRQSQSGTSRVQQGGEVVLTTGEAVPLARLSASGQAASACSVSITLKAPDHLPAHYHFDCP